MTRRPSLAGRLSRALAACVALALIVMVAASTLVMRSWMLGNMDSELHHQGGRGDHDDEGEGDARGQRARQPPGEGTTARHWGSRMMYPAPRTVRMRAGRSASIFLRR